MTIPTDLSSRVAPPAIAPLSERIRATYDLHPVLRRAVALGLLAEAVTGKLAIAFTWSSLGLLLRHCSIELMGKPHTVPPVAGDWDRALYFSKLADKAHDVARKLWRAGRNSPRRQASGRQSIPVIAEVA